MHFNRVLSLLLFVAVVFAAALVAATLFSDDAEAIDPYDPSLKVKTGGYELSQSGSPEDKVKFYLTLFNQGANDDTYNITASSLPAGWLISISPNEVSIDEDKEEDIIISITIPSYANDTDSVDVSITATSQDDPDSPPAKSTLLITCEVDQEFDVELSTLPGEPTNKKSDPGDPVYYELNITNDGNGEDTISVAKDLPESSDDWVVIFNFNSITLERNEFSVLNISVTPSSNADAGQVPIDVIITSEDGTEKSSQTLVLDVNYIADFIVLPYGDNQKDVEPKGSVTYGITIENKGNDEDVFHFSIKSGTWSADGWTASLDYNSITVSQDEQIDITTLLTVNVPDGLADDEASIIVNVTSDDGTVIKTLVTRTTISQDFDPAINIVGGTSKSVDPGADVEFSIVVFNNGNGEDEIILSIKNDDVAPGSWGSFSDSSVTLAARTNTTITLTITPPSDAEYKDEGYTIQIFGMSEDGENQSTLKTLKVNVNKKFDLSVTISGASTKKVDPDDSVDFTVTIKNKGNAEDTILLTLYGEDDTWKPGWGSIVSSVDLLQDSSTTVTLSVTVADDAAKADYKIGIRGASDEDPNPNPVNKTAEVIVSVNQTYAIIITIPESQKSVDVDSSVQYEIDVKNDGTGNDTLTLEVVVYPEGWLVNFDESTLDLGPKQTSTITMTVETPSDEDAAAFYVNFTATSQNAPELDPVVEIGTTITTVNQTYEFDIVPDPDYSSVKPGDTVTFDISFVNQGTGADHVKVIKGGDFPDTWTVSIASDVSLDLDETIVKTLTVSIDDETLKDEYHITLTGTSDDDPHTPSFTREVQITINVEQEYNLTASISVDTKSIDPFPATEVHKVTFSFTVNNTGTGQDKFDFNAVFDTTPARKNGWSVAFSPQTIDLGVKKESVVDAIITVPYKENIATYGLTITAKSQGEPSVTRSVKVFIDVNQTYSVDLLTDLNSQQVTPAEIESTLKDVNFTITVTNTGTGADKFYLSLTGLPSGWFINLAGNTGIIAQGDARDFVLNLRVPGRELPGTYEMDVISTSDGRSAIFDNVTIKVIVDELHSLSVTTNEPTKKGNVDSTTDFIVAVTNEGTGFDTFNFDFRDVPDWFTVSFPEGTDTEEVGPKNQTTNTVAVTIDSDTPNAKFSFNVTVTSNEEDEVFEVIKLTVDVNQSYALSVSQTGQPAGNNVDPGAIVTYQFELSNDGTGTDSITIEIPITFEGGERNVPTGWVITPIPYSFDLEPDEVREIDIEVEVDDDALPEENEITVWFYYHDGDEKEELTFDAIVNQTYDVSTNINFNLLQIFPGFNKTAILTVKNTGTGIDFYKIEISNVDGITATVEPSLTEDMDPDATVLITLDFAIDGGQEPRTDTFYINVTSKKAEEDGFDVVELTTIDVKIKETYGVKLNKGSGTYSVTPTYLNDGDTSFQLTINNEGTSEDTFNFEFGDDAISQIYKTWITLPDSVTLGDGEASTVTVQIAVPPQESQAIAIVGQYDVSFTVYSDNARKNNVESEETTDDFKCTVDVKEYRHASITAIIPSSVAMDVDDIKLINVTIKNEGNGYENYSFVKDGEQPGNLNTGWFDFLEPSRVDIAPRGSAQVTIQVDLTNFQDASVGLHDLSFHAESESTYDTDMEEFRIDIEEKFGGKFVSGDTESSKPDETIDMEITVRNDGNARHEFKLDNPILPDDWEYTWSGGSSKDIDGDSSDSFTLRITIPSDYEKALAKTYNFQITGKYEEDGGGFANLEGFAWLNLTVETVYKVDVSAEDTSDEAKPGESRTFKVEVKNSGNTVETYQLSILNDPQNTKSAKDWANFEGTEPGDKITIPVGETKFLDIIVDVPVFTPENDEAEQGTYGFLVKAKSSNDSKVEGEQDYQILVEELYKVTVWSDIPGKNETLKENDDTIMTYTIFIRNLGNMEDDIIVTVPNDELSGDKRDWEVRFGTSSSKTLNLKSTAQTSVTMTVIIDKSTDPGEYTLRVRAESQGDTAVYVYSTVYVNLTKAAYGLDMSKVQYSLREVNPADESEIEFKFTLTNTGNQDDTYSVEVETPLGSGTYRDWIMEFDNDNGERVDQLSVPSDLPGSTDDVLGKNDRIDITLFVTVALDEGQGLYEDISISATSDNDNSQVMYLYFNLSVILPNIRLSNDLSDFSIDPDSGIEEDDSIDINLRVYNDGLAETDEFYVFFYNGKKDDINENPGNWIAYEKIENIPAESYNDILVTWEDIEGGENDLYARADKPIRTGVGATKNSKGTFLEDGLVLESKENDNAVSIDDDYQDAVDLRPDLTITNIDWDDNEVDETTTVTVTVANVGSAKAEIGSATVSLKIGGDTMKSEDTNIANPTLPEDIDANDEIDIEFTWKIEEEDNFTAKATVDHPDDIDSSNDRKTVYIVTEEKGTGIGGDNIFLYIGFGAILLILLLVIVVLMMKNSKAGAGGPPAGGPPRKKGPGGKRPPGKGPGGKPGARGPPPKPGQKPITPPKKGPGGKPGPGGRPPAKGPGGKPGGPGGSAKPCPKCKTPIPITTAKRPLKLVCPKCGASGTLTK